MHDTLPDRPGLKKRLIVCLDGTWNKQDDSTNVLHLYNSIIVGDVSDGWQQRRYYDEGVGTGVLDGVSGGAFGLGLEDNVREAMNWLIGNYDDGDEIYIYGFSRGAYTARSLMAFIAKVGIPLRGAPLTVNQLWQGYCLIGRQEQGLQNWWDNFAGKPELPFRSIDALRDDAWRAALPDNDWRRDYKPFTPPDEASLKPVEKLIRQWSRRPPITFLGIFDTVGSMGIEALSIPGLRSQLAAFHNMRMHSIVGRARHAIAIDENRSNFSLTPLNEFVPQGKAGKEYNQTIEQQWFVGAHSNIGGGYEDNVLSAEAFKWMLEGSEQCGLQFKSAPPAEPEAKIEPLDGIRDSFAEFAAWFWVPVVRAKRNFRVIAPEPLAFGDERGSCAHSLRAIDETLSPSALAILQSKAGEERGYAPPNLVEWALRTKQTFAEALNLRCTHRWSARGWGARLWLVLWAIIAAMGLDCLPAIFAQTQTIMMPKGVLALFAGYAVLMDWLESWLNHKRALQPYRGSIKAIQDVIYWTRAFVVVLFFVGFVFSLWTVLRHVWHSENFAFYREVWHTWKAVFALPLLVAVALTPWQGAKTPAAKKAAAFNPWATAGGLIAAVSFFIAIRAGVIHWFGWTQLPDFLRPATDTAAVNAGALLLVELALLYFLNSYHSWIGEPMREAGLSSVFKLQLAFTPAQVKAVFDRWVAALKRRRMVGDPDDGWTDEQRATHRMRHCVCESLWRDVFGFVFIYTLLFITGLWFLNAKFGVAAVASWLTFPLIVALLDQIENAIHGLHYLPRYARRVLPPEGTQPTSGYPSTVIVSLGIVTTWTKMIGFMVAMILVNWAILRGGWYLINAYPGWASAGWRGLLALVAWASIVAGLAVQLLTALRASWWKALIGMAVALLVILRFGF